LEHLQLEEAKASDPGQKFTIQESIREAKAKLAELEAANREQARSHSTLLPPGGGGTGGEGQPTKVDLDHLPTGAPHFLGRETELAALDAAWADQGKTAILELIAPGGTGKTALMTRWVDRLRAEHWRGAAAVFGWSFYSQGSGEDRQASEDGFLEAALRFFGVNIAPAASPWDKGAALAEAVARQKTLLILDGLEPLQYPPTAAALPGTLKAPGVQTLLKRLASRGQPGLTLITSREHLADLADRVRNAERPEAGVQVLDLGNLADADGAKLLHRLGVTRAGEADIGPADQELQAASREVSGHALTLSLLGSYLARAKGGDVRKIKEVDFAKAVERTDRGHAFHAMRAYETWFKREGDAGAREGAALKLLGFFDRPATKANLAALVAPPAIPGLTEALEGLDQDDWHLTLANLSAAGLAKFEPKSGGLDAHPLVREYFAAALAQKQPQAWREGHRRIYEQLKKDTPHRPDTLTGLQPLYQAVAHGCKAGLVQEACVEVYLDRILRGTGSGGNYSTFKLGAIGADLGAVACFFVEPWRRLAPDLQEGDQAWLLNEAAFRLRALGRLAEALEPMRAGAEMRVKQEAWPNAARFFSNLSELELSLGRIKEAVADGERSVAYADRSGDAFLRMGFRATLADARHQAGEIEAARKGFVEAEGLQAESQPQYPLLYSLQGFCYCDLLLAGAARAVWVGTCSDKGARFAADVGINSDLQAVAKRAAQTLAWAEANNLSLLTKALDHLTLARCALYADLLQGRRPGEEAQSHTEAAVSGLRAAGSQHHIPRGLLTRALLRHALGDLPGAEADLKEAEDIAARGGMKLFLADLALTRARLFRDPAQLAQARALIEECGYRRRLPELEDAEAAAKDWPQW
jgi:tetratricopeptide (TPR) repeat protein